MKIINKKKQTVNGIEKVIVRFEDDSYCVFTKEEFRSEYPNEIFEEVNTEEISDKDVEKAIHNKKVDSNKVTDTHKITDASINSGSQIPTILGIAIFIGGLVFINKYGQQIYNFFNNALRVAVVGAGICAIVYFGIGILSGDLKFRITTIFSAIFGAFLGFGASMCLILPLFVVLFFLSLGNNTASNTKFDTMYQIFPIMIYVMTIGGGLVGLVEHDWSSWGGKNDGCLGPCIIAGIIGAFLLYVGR